MYPPQFDYERVDTVEEAISILEERDGAMILAGGHSLIPILKLRQANPSMLVDIGRISKLKGVSSANGNMHIGALTTHATLAASDMVPAGLSEAARLVADRQVRNRGTIGGNVAHADPASDLPTILAALSATFHVTGPAGSRLIAASDFFVDLLSTALLPAEVLTSVELVKPGDGWGSAYTKLENPASNYAILGSGVNLHIEDSKCASATVVVGGVNPIPTRLASVEAALIGNELSPSVLEGAAALAESDLMGELLSDIHASADYRRAMASVYVHRALEKAALRAQS